MVKRVSSNQVSGGGNKIQLPSNVPARLIQDVGRSTLSINKLIAPTVLDLQKSEGRKVARQGIVDGQNGKLDPKLLFNPSFRGQAYTDNALSHYTKTLELQTRQGINDIIKENPRDSVKAEKLIGAFIQGKLEGMPQELRERTGNHYALQSKISANANLARIRKTENDLRIKEQEAVDLQLDMDIAKEAPLNGAGLGSNSFSVQQSSLIVAMRDRKQIEARYEAEINDGVTTIPAHSETEKINALAKYDKIIGSSMIQEQFRGQKDKAQYLRDFQLGKLEENFILKDDGGNTLLDLRPGPQARASLASGMRTIINAENAEVKRRQTAVKGSIDSWISDLKNSVPKTAEQEAEIGANVEQFGTEAQIERWHNWQDFKHEYGELRTKAPVKINQALINIDAEIKEARVQGDIVTPGMIERRDIVAKLKNEKQELLNKDLLAAGYFYGDIENVGPLLDSDLMRKQADQARFMSEKYNMPLAVLNGDNLIRFKKALDDPNLTGDKLEGLLNIFDGFGEDKFQALSELAPKHPGYAHLAALMDYQKDHVTSAAAQGFVLTKQGGTNKVTFPRVDTKNAEAEILENTFRLNSKARDGVVEVARAIYTAMVFNSGGSEATKFFGTSATPGEFNKELYKKALQQATGQKDLKTGTTGGIVTLKGHSVMVPMNMKQEDFKKGIESLTKADFEKGGVNGGIIQDTATLGTEGGDTKAEFDKDDTFLVSMGDGQYVMGRADANGNTELLRGATDPDSDNPAVRQGFYVLDLTNALDAKSEREAEEEVQAEEKIQAIQKEQAERKVKSDKKAREIFSSGAEIVKEAPESIKDMVLEGSSAITKGIVNAPETLEKAKEGITKGLDSTIQQLEQLFDNYFGKAEKGAKGFLEFTEKSGTELAKLAGTGLSKITEGIISSGDNVRAGIETVKEFADKNTEEAKQLAKLVTKKARKLTNEASVKLFAKTVAPMIVSPGRSDGLPAPENVMTALVSVESSFKANQVSPQGARGPAQILPGTAQDIAEQSKLGFTRDEILNDPEKNIMGGMYYLYEVLLKRYSGPDRLKFAVAAYHGGLGNIDNARAKVAHKNDFNSVYPKLGPKTQDYVTKVMSRIRG